MSPRGNNITQGEAAGDIVPVGKHSALLSRDGHSSALIGQNMVTWPGDILQCHPGNITQVATHAKGDNSITYN
jgi:hypothetical protein